MEFKKIAVLGLAMSLALVGCGKKTDGPAKKVDKAVEKVEVKKDVKASLYDQLLAMEPSDIKAFNIQGGFITGYNNNKEETIFIPEDDNGTPLTTITQYTFANDNVPLGVRLGNSITTIEPMAFTNSERLEVFVAGNGLKKIGNSAFLNCGGLKTVVLNEGLEEIEDLAFSGTKELKELTIPNSLKKSGESLFLFNDNIVIKGTANSLAKQIAEENGVKYEEIK